MSFNIVKVRSSLNYSIIGLKIKHIQGGIIDKMAEILLKYIEIYCVYCYYFHGPRRIRDTTNVTNNRFTGTYNTTGHTTTGAYLRLIENAFILRVPVQRAAPLLNEEYRQIVPLQWAFS